MIEVDRSLGGKRVVGVLDRLAESRCLPETITTDNGPEFTGKALDEWACRTGVKLHFIGPGKPMENAYAESLIGKLRDECLSGNRFLSLTDAREIIEGWRKDYNSAAAQLSWRPDTTRVRRDHVGTPIGPGIASGVRSHWTTHKEPNSRCITSCSARMRGALGASSDNIESDNRPRSGPKSISRCASGRRTGQRQGKLVLQCDT